MEFEFEVSSPNRDTVFHYFDDVMEGMEYINREYGHMWARYRMQVVITYVNKRDK